MCSIPNMEFVISTVKYLFYPDVYESSELVILNWIPGIYKHSNTFRYSPVWLTNLPPLSERHRETDKWINSSSQAQIAECWAYSDENLSAWLIK